MRFGVVPDHSRHRRGLGPLFHVRNRGANVHFFTDKQLEIFLLIRRSLSTGGSQKHVSTKCRSPFAATCRGDRFAGDRANRGRLSQPKLARFHPRLHRITHRKIALASAVSNNTWYDIGFLCWTLMESCSSAGLSMVVTLHEDVECLQLLAEVRAQQRFD